MRPIHGQPGLYRHGGLRGLGAPPISELQAKLTAVQSQYDATKTSITPLTNAYGPLDQDVLKRLVVAIQLHQGTNVILGAAAFVGLLRMGLSSAIGNISRAQSILNGSPVGHEDLIASLLTTAQSVLDQMTTIINATITASGAVAAGLRTIGLSGVRGGLGAFGVDDATLAIIAAVGVIVGAVLVYELVSRVQAASNARAVADSACQRDAAAGHPCTGTQWATYVATADAQAHQQSLVPNFADILNQVGNLVLYGGLAVVAAAIGYAVWTTLPAARVARGALTSRAQRLSGLNGTPAEHRAKAREYLTLSRDLRSRDRRRSLRFATMAADEAMWTDDAQLKKDTFKAMYLLEEGQ